jgi:hypothetical protein
MRFWFVRISGVTANQMLMGGVERGERNIAIINVEKIITALGLQASEFFNVLNKPVKGKV